MYLPDTNIFIKGIKGDEPEASFLKKIIQKEQLVISVVAIGEYLSKANQKQAEVFYKLVNTFRVLNIDREVARVATEMRKESLKTKRTYMIDCFLAAQAKLNHLTLVTNNKKDFPMKDIKIISP